MTLDGANVNSGHTFSSVVGQPREVGAPSPQRKGRRDYNFRNWSNGLGQTHFYVVPAGSSTLKATYRRLTTLHSEARSSGGEQLLNLL